MYTPSNKQAYTLYSYLQHLCDLLALVVCNICVDHCKIMRKRIRISGIVGIGIIILNWLSVCVQNKHQPLNCRKLTVLL